MASQSRLIGEKDMIGSKKMAKYAQIASQIRPRKMEDEEVYNVTNV